jgi:hypothetical protein
VNTIPSSPIPQPTPKIGTRYIWVDSDIDGLGESWTGKYAWLERADAEQHRPSGSHIYMLLDPADAAELARLRKVEESAANRHIEDASLGTPEQASASFAAWVKVRDERIDFEKKIGGGT